MYSIKDPEFLPLFSGYGSDKKPMVFAGPCSAENREMVLECGKQLSQIGISIFRAGLWKPRTRPGSFEGRGAIALPWLREVREKYGLKIITEVANEWHVRCALKGGVDGVWIGARTVANPFAVQEIADAIRELDRDVTVLIKNPVSPDLELWIGAIERFLRAGITRLGAVHRGFSKYGENVYRNAPIWSIPIELKRRFPSLPLFHDPSHCGGKSSMVALLSQQALDLGFDGLMIESHPHPQEALSDSSQQVTPSELTSILQGLDLRKNADSGEESLTMFRKEVDSLDAELIDVLARRMHVCESIGEFKSRNGMKVVQEDRYSRLLSDRVFEGVSKGLDANFLREIFSAVHSESVRRQLDIIGSRSEENQVSDD